MKLSQTFVKTLRNAPKDESTRGIEYLIRAGYVHKEMAGVYDYLPLGLHVLENIKNIVREELNNIGGQEVLMSALQNPDLWLKTNRWDDNEVDIWFKTELNAGGQVGLAPTHEEPITNMLKTYVRSYKDLPLSVYQFQTKFRNELRAKSGILRTREFIMKDLYSFHTSEEDLDNYYETVSAAYDRIYKRTGLGDYTFKTFASGGIFAKYSHEYQTIIPIGEDTVWFNKDKTLALNDEVFNDEVLAEFGTQKSDFEPLRACEVGNIFKLKFKYSDPLELKFSDQNNQQQTVYMGCYGLGISRLAGVIAEKFADEKGLVWPIEIAPFKFHIIGIGEKGIGLAEKIHDQNKEVVLLDDRDLRPGEKFADADLMGIPYRIVISDKTLEQNSVEYTERRTGETKPISIEEIEKLISTIDQ